MGETRIPSRETFNFAYTPYPLKKGGKWVGYTTRIPRVYFRHVNNTFANNFMENYKGKVRTRGVVYA